MLDLVLLLFSLLVILMGAEGFTNGVEWLGKKLKLTEGTVGSILAAVGTALPETMIPIIAIIFGGSHAGEEIGIGAILGAPFMLSTLAFFISGVAVIVYRKRRPGFPKMNLDTRAMERDLGFFLLVYTVAALTSLLGAHNWKQVAAVGLVIAYVCYAYLTVINGHRLEEGEKLNPLYLVGKESDPQIAVILIQVILALGLIIGGAHLFVNGVEKIAVIMGISPFILALIIAPIATELPEKFNSVIWLSRGKDTLAMGNITGAMVFQSSVIPALGITMTNWVLTREALISVTLALISAGLVFSQIKRKRYLTPYTLIWGGALYGIFLFLVFLRLY